MAYDEFHPADNVSVTVRGCPFLNADYTQERFIQRCWIGRQESQHLYPLDEKPCWLEEGEAVLIRVDSEMKHAS